MDDLTRAKELASLAVVFDRTQKVDKAIECYHTASLILDKLIPNVPENQKKVFRDKIREYLDRAAQLQQNDITSQEQSTRALKKLYFLMEQALDADAADLKETAFKLYMQALELVSSLRSNFPHISTNIHGITEKALNRAEILKQEISPRNNKPAPISQRHFKPLLQRETSIQLHVDVNRSSYTEEEKAVLKATSKINNNLYMPFMKMDLSEKFQYAIPFEDKDGLLMLSTKQQQEFDKWVRPDEISADPKLIIGNINYYSIKQTVSI
ncbi:Calpain-7 [Eumeta japonica]|uniref:Calpain-7 n=1 Tax=Eumeta variegata TaxID=151549 RepID=A0A4C1Y8P4_EUMVA|nr:Calpain-7 [Eumeta japonica]